MSPAASPEAPRAGPIPALVVVLAYMALQIALFAGHSPWRDEGQAWLLVERLAWPGDFLVIPGEGHPPLWYWLLAALHAVTGFDQARYVTLLVALVNAVLLLRLLRNDLLLLTLLLFGIVVAQYWGLNFRPYGLVLTLVLGALLLDRQGRPLAGTWLLALACGLHFFSGFLFAFWLLAQLRRGMDWRALLAPSLLAALFGVSAILSAAGNPAGTPSTDHFIAEISYALAWPLTWPPLRTWPLALASLALIAIGLWRDKLLLAALLALMLAFAIGTSVLYGQSAWHSAFMMVMTLMAFLLAGGKARRWALLVLLVPQALVGIAITSNRLQEPAWAKPDVYAAILADAGPDFDPARQLIAWQDFMLTATAASRGITYISGNNGELLGPIDWRRRRENQIAPIVLANPGPYWLVCGECNRVLEALARAGRQTTLLVETDNFDDGPVSAYRVD